MNNVKNIMRKHKETINEFAIDLHPIDAHVSCPFRST